MHILAALDRFVLQLEANGRSPHTIHQYQRHIKRLAHWTAETALSGEIEEIGHDDVARFLASPWARLRPDDGVKKASSVNALRSSIRGFFGYLHRAGLIASDPSALTRRALCASGTPRGLSDDEADRLLKVLSEATDDAGVRDHALIHLLLGSGIRIGSALNLDVDDVDLERAELRLRQAKGNRTETVLLGTKIRDHLTVYMGARTQGPLFRGHRDRRLSQRHAHRRFQHWLAKAGIDRPYSPHSCRHRFALDLYKRTQDIALVKEALRHRSITSTLVYARTSEDRLREALG